MRSVRMYIILQRQDRYITSVYVWSIRRVSRRHNDHQPEILYNSVRAYRWWGIEAYSDDYVYPTLGANPKFCRRSIHFHTFPFSRITLASITLSEKIVVNQKNKVYNGLCMFRNVYKVSSLLAIGKEIRMQLALRVWVGYVRIRRKNGGKTSRKRQSFSPSSDWHWVILTLNVCIYGGFVTQPYHFY